MDALADLGLQILGWRAQAHAGVHTVALDHHIEQGAELEHGLVEGGVDDLGQRRQHGFTGQGGHGQGSFGVRARDGARYDFAVG